MKKLTVSNLTLDLLFSAVIKNVMRGGKFTQAKQLVLNSFSILKQRYKIKLPLLFFFFAVEKLTPKIKFLKKKIAGRKTFIPVFLPETQGLLQAIRYLISISVRTNKSFSEAFAFYIVQAYKKVGKPMIWYLGINKLAMESRPNLRFLKKRR
jgi:ribosomal protein S7